MKKIIPALLFLAALIAVLVSKPLTQTAQARTIRLFIIGNSFSQNATQHLPQIVKEGGHELIIGRAEAPGHSLQQHWTAVEANEADASKGKIYRDKSLREILSTGNWDIVTIQQASVASSHVDSYRPYAQKLRDFVKQLQPNAEVVLHQTWAYRSDASSFGVVALGARAQSDREMWEKLTVAYYTTAAELGLRVIPVGNAFWRATADANWAYKKDPNFHFAAPVFPNLPDQTNSLHEGYRWENQTKFGLDANHANEAGKYLGSLVWYGFLFNESPEKVTAVPGGVPANFAAYLRQVAAQALGMAPLNAAASGASTPVAQAPTESKPSAQTPAPKPASQASAPAPGGLSTAQGRGADTSIRGGSYSARAFGSHPVLRVRNTSNLEHARKTYLRFDLSLLPQAVKGAKTAVLNLTVGAAENNSPADKTWTFQVFGLKDGDAGENWSEGAAGWDNAPANDAATASTLTQSAQLLGTFTLSGKGEEGKTVTFSSPELLKFLQGDGNGTATLIITRKEVGDSSAENVIHIFASKENEQLAAPSLNVGF